MLAEKASVPEQPDFCTLVLPLSGVLYARALVLERTPGEARDLVQDTLERALRAFHQFQPGTSVRRWVFRIMHNLFIDRYRRRAHELRSQSIDELELPAPEPEASAPWEDLSHLDVETILAGLARPFREVVELHFLEDRSYQDISRSLQIPTATVGTRLLRARNKLRVMIQPQLDRDQRLRGRGMA